MSEMSESRACTIIPPYILEAIAQYGDEEIAAPARRSLQQDHTLRPDRGGQTPQAPARPVPPGPSPRDSAAPGAKPAQAGGPRRTISDAQGQETLPGVQVRAEGEPATGDAAADEAYDGLGATWELYSTAYGRDSLDGQGLPLLGTVHYGQAYDNAFWDGTQMVFGDGDGRLFNRLTVAVDVIGHELTHGFTEHTAALTYQGQSGALNESVSDVFGALVKQRLLGHDAAAADWLIGQGLFTDRVNGVALRSMKEPGTAYDDPVLGKDPQPATMDGYVETTDDNGGVHINSGIPNHAFYLAATAIGGNAWEGAGQVWFDVLTGGGVPQDCDFAMFARLTQDAAVARFGDGSAEARAVQTAWAQVGVTTGAGGSGPDQAPSEPAGGGGDSGQEHPAPDRGPAPESELLVRRTGGIAGLSRERRTTLGDLPDEDAEGWRSLLAGRELQAMAAGRSYPDAYSYRVVCEPAGMDVTVPEPQLPQDVRDLFERTLAQMG